MAKNGQAQIL